MAGWLSRILSRLVPPPPSIRPGEDVIFVDTRTRAEYRRGHVEGALHIPHSRMAERWTELEPHAGKRILVYCLSGHRAGSAAAVLRSHGIAAENAGGIGGLRRAGRSIAKGD